VIDLVVARAPGTGARPQDISAQNPTQLSTKIFSGIEQSKAARHTIDAA
jgi:hypothetical protein